MTEPKNTYEASLGKKVRTTIGEVTIPSSPKVEHTCSRCGKRITDPKSIELGMGPTCRRRTMWLKGKTLEEHYASITLEEVPEDYIRLSALIEAANKIGISSHRILQACGGDRALRNPEHPFFQVYYRKNRRYVSKKALEHLQKIQ